MKKKAFLENAKFLFREFGIVPLMYGSLGLEYITGENLNVDDIDILIPGVFLQGVNANIKVSHLAGKRS